MYSAMAGLTMFAVTMTAECRGQLVEATGNNPVPKNPESARTEQNHSELSQSEPGTLVICGGGTLPETLRAKVVNLAGGEFARIVVISTASQTADVPDVETYVAWWRKQKLAELTILHTRSREEADREEFVAPLKRATGVWFMGGNQAWLIDTYSGTRTEVELHKVLERGGVIGGTSAGAAVMSKLMIRRGNSNPELGRGFGFVDGAIIDQHFVRRFRQDRLFKVIEQYPDLVGLGIDEGTALIVQGQKLSVEGDSEVRVCFARTNTREPVVESMRAGDTADLGTFGRIAAARLRPHTPALAKNETPQVPEGTLVIVGGDAVPIEATERFVAAAGGTDALVAFVSLDENESLADGIFMAALRKAGAKSVQRVQVTSRKQADDPQIIALLKTARGIWISGSRPHKFVESCLGTVAEQLCRDLLHRGGVIGGTAAGGVVQGEILMNGSPMPMKQMVVDGYDRGFGFLTGVAIAASSQRKEASDELDQLRLEYPQVVGLGIEESTALIVHGHVMEVVGQNQVAVFDHLARDNSPSHAMLHHGDRYDFKGRVRMANRRAVEPTTGE